MPPSRRLLLGVLIPLCAAASGVALADPLDPGDADGTIDDPKVARRLGARIDVPSGEATSESDGLPVMPAAPVEPLADATPTVVAPAAAPVGQPLTPRLKVAYRRFTFSQIGAKGTSGAGASEPFDVLSVDLYPVSNVWRFGLTAQYGWQEGTFRQNGDAFFAAATSLGWQIPGPVVTPFIEGFAGAGLMQRTKKDLALNTIATAYGELGVDLGMEVFLAPHFCLSLGVGWIHLANGYARSQAFETFSEDTWSFKIGMGL